MCSLDVIPDDFREDIIRELRLEPGFTGSDEEGLTIFVPKEGRGKEKPGPQLVLEGSMSKDVLLRQLTPTQQVIASGVVNGKEIEEIAKELSDTYVKVSPSDVNLAYECVRDIVHSMAVYR